MKSLRIYNGIIGISVLLSLIFNFIGIILFMVHVIFGNGETKPNNFLNIGLLMFLFVILFRKATNAKRKHYAQFDDFLNDHP